MSKETSVGSLKVSVCSVIKWAPVPDVLPPGGGHLSLRSVPSPSVRSHPVRADRPGEAAAPARLQREPGGLPRPPAAPRGGAGGQRGAGEAALGGWGAAGPPQLLRLHAAGPGCSGGTPGGGPDPPTER